MNVKLLKLTTISLFIAIGVVISPLLRIEGMCPTAHLVNVVCAALLGPYYAFACAAAIGVIRMALMGIPPLALTGAVFGAFFSGLFYRLGKGKIIYAVAGEVIGTGLVGSMASYPAMAFLWGRVELSLFFYTPMFTGASLIGGSAAYALLKILSKNGALKKMQIKLNDENKLHGGLTNEN